MHYNVALATNAVVKEIFSNTASINISRFLNYALSTTPVIKDIVFSNSSFVMLLLFT
jgi:hypothetical protein